jgi:hypothetical protein
MYYHAVKLGLQTKYNEENGIIKKNCANDVGAWITASATSETRFYGNYEKINIVN